MSEPGAFDAESADGILGGESSRLKHYAATNEVPQPVAGKLWARNPRNSLCRSRSVLMSTATRPSRPSCTEPHPPDAATVDIAKVISECALSAPPNVRSPAASLHSLTVSVSYRS
jgi:hypothetical protein